MKARYITAPIAIFGALMLGQHLMAKLLIGYGVVGADDAMGVLVLAGVVHIIGTRA